MAPSCAGRETARRVQGAALLAEDRADAFVRVNQTEVERRAASGLTQVPYTPLLDALLGLPSGAEVPWGCLGNRVRRVLAAAPEGVVYIGEAGVRRLLTPPVAVTAVVVPLTSRWSTTLRRAASFGRVAPTWLSLRREPTREELLEADFVGVGVWVEGQKCRPPRERLAPSPVQQRFNASLWAFYERAYDVWLTDAVRSGQRGADRQDARTA